MGFRTNVKARHADEDAKRAMDEGHSVYVHKLGIPNVGSAGSTSVSGAAEVIEAIEAAGWHLEHMAAVASNMVMVFRA